MTSCKLDQSTLEELRLLLWGSSLKEDVFSRWSQGFIFSEEAPSALVQFEGGPCAVIAPVQAFVVKCALFKDKPADFKKLTCISNAGANMLLLEALKEILLQISQSDFVLVDLNGQVGLQESGACAPCQESHNLGETSHQQGDATNVNSLQDASFTQETFHSSLRIIKCSNCDELHKALERSLPQLQSHYGVLLYLYSILLTKGINQIKNEVEDPSEPLIDGIYGHGSQSLINLLMTSHATTNVWDNDKDISGLKLRGIQQQASVGFLTLLEHMRYCEVGWYLKNPVYPIWLLGSETHLTVLFSHVEELVIRDSPATTAKHVFSQFDPEGNGFISSSLLQDVMRSLDLVADTEYVEIMKTKLDSEELGIITSSSFMETFFSEQPAEHPQSFMLYHCNALPQSNPGGKVGYLEGKAVLAEEVDTQFITDTTPIKLCLQTKWPSIEINWSNGITPSLN
ncbi:ubiquitin carboxyl-terminal hydrolase MINDY-3 [Elysia marginata]|uniref:Ubiquitin carboxyl-terminal hydrolase MINDY n=1 Tax=Elysia marginata TaxID=1093978 RepID=A0AAV4HV04_9GAST|nr:ubiquitin carboxyl-terminal hydrolase MINDY-3 [Elysia marginata]